MGDLHAPVLGSVVLASATSWLVLRMLLGNNPLFEVPQYQLVHPMEFAIYALLGVAGGLVSVAFTKLLLPIREQFLRLPAWTRWFQPVAGGLVTGLIGLGPAAGFGGGLWLCRRRPEWANGRRINGVASGLETLGGDHELCFGQCRRNFWTQPVYWGNAWRHDRQHRAPLDARLHGDARSVCSGRYGHLFAGIVRAPMTSVVMIFETTHDYAVIVPLMISNMVSFFISSRFQPQPIYEALAIQDGIHLPRGETFRRQDQRRSGQMMRAPTPVMGSQMTVREAFDRAHNAEFDGWPVTDERGVVGASAWTGSSKPWPMAKRRDN